MGNSGQDKHFSKLVRNVMWAYEHNGYPPEELLESIKRAFHETYPGEEW